MVSYLFKISDFFLLDLYNFQIRLLTRIEESRKIAKEVKKSPETLLVKKNGFQLKLQPLSEIGSWVILW